jgi:hypothetical protein
LSATNIPLETFAERVWYAYQCLPRGRDGKLPSIDSLLGRPRRAMLTRLFSGERSNSRPETRMILAEVLNVPLEWLDSGKGDPPRLTGPYRCNLGVCQDRDADYVRRFIAIGVDEDSVNNFVLAVLWLREKLDTRAIEEVALQAKGRENLVTREEWAHQLRLAQIRITGAGWELCRPNAASIERTSAL